MRRALWNSVTCHTGRVVLIGCLLVSSGGSAFAYDSPRVVTTPSAESKRDTASVVLMPSPRTFSRADWDALNLGRAVDLWLGGDIRGAAALLETIDISSTSTFAQADRAAFLLAVASFQLGDVEAFHRVADRAGAASASPWHRWIRYCLLVESLRGGYAEIGTIDELRSDVPGADVLGAALLLEMGRAYDALLLLETSDPDESFESIHLYLQAMARAAVGGDPAADWQELANRKPRSALESDLIGAALLQLAAELMESGRDATELLQRMPENSRHAPRASHILGLIAHESGDSGATHQILTDVLISHPTYSGRREIELALGNLRMDREQWGEALETFESTDQDWLAEFKLLAALEDASALDDVWQVWERQQQWREEIRLAPEVLLEAFFVLAQWSLDLERTPHLNAEEDMASTLWPPDDSNMASAAWDTTGVLDQHHPDASEWDAIRSVQQQLRHASGVLARQDRVIADKQRDIERRIHYLNIGNDRTLISALDLARAVARLEEILAQQDAVVARLEAVRDSSIVQIATRTREMTEEIRRELIFIQAVRHFHVDGPNRDRPEDFPAGVPDPPTLLTSEQILAVETAEFLTLFAEHYPAVIARSFAEIWEPRLTGDSRLLHASLMAELRRARHIGSEIDSTIAFHANDPEFLAALARRDELAAAVDSLGVNEARLRIEIARAVAERSRAQMNAEREAIDYHLADASYELAVEVATNPATAEDTSLVAPARRHAILHADSFLARHPESLARGESRFRLADLRLMQARDDFQIRMAGFLDDEPSADDIENRSLAPFVDYAPAVALYRAILVEDPGFPHLDAVLFNLGMILSDDGQADAHEFLTRLVQEYPESPSCQEAWLRMGSDSFDRKDFAGCITYFEQAIAGTDPTFTAIALYKLGWARFEEDQFRDSADAFRRMMDLYAEHEDIAKAMDLRDEAEEYFVHSLARSGGATAFADYFDQLGYREYEPGILLALGHLMRSISLYEDAVECDELWLVRYPMHPQALPVARRLVDTYRTSDKPELAREAKLVQAERFLPGSEWYDANDDKEMWVEAQAFAQSAYRETAAFYHHEARKNNNPDSWQMALANYERFLAHWPDTEDSPRMHYLAGEAATRVHGYPSALAHFSVAAQSGTDSLALDATWQRVAITDEWYQSTRQTDTSNGSDSLAVLLRDTGQDFLDRFPGDKRCADIMWRQGNIAYAHEWYAKAAVSLALLSERYPADPRALKAIRMSGDARYRRAEYDAAGFAYEQALVLARTAGEDSVTALLEATIPLCYYKHAESVAAADEKNGDRKAAPLFQRVARQWPEFDHADLALYRAGLGFAAKESYGDATAAWEQLLATYPQSEYARDSAIQIARAHEKSGNTQSAARAYERFSRLHPDDPDASEALLKSVDLLVEAGDEAGAEDMRTAFLDRFPGETETVMEIREERAMKEIASVTSGSSTMAALLTAAAGSGAKAVPSSQLQAYLELAVANPELASPTILAQVDYFKAEEAYPGYALLKLTQPLPQSLEMKKKKLEELIALYNRCSGHGVSVYTRASAHRIGQVLIEFGDALMDSELPSGLSEDDFLAYNEVIEEQSWAFYDRGENAWTELLQQLGDADEDPGEWIARTREALWPRLAQRFLHQPEVDYPLVAATPPAEPEAN